ncbi:unnamed protein product, partial [Notodromas monacha]
HYLCEDLITAAAAGASEDTTTCARQRATAAITAAPATHAKNPFHSHTDMTKAITGASATAPKNPTPFTNPTAPTSAATAPLSTASTPEFNTPNAATKTATTSGSPPGAAPAAAAASKEMAPPAAKEQSEQVRRAESPVLPRSQAPTAPPASTVAERAPAVSASRPSVMTARKVDMFKLVILSLAFCLCLSQANYIQRNPNDPSSYNFRYQVRDNIGNNYGHQEQRQGDNTQGEYRVLLPDGRVQIVSYRVSGDSGFVANVEYEGEARQQFQSQGFQGQKFQKNYNHY